MGFMSSIKRMVTIDSRSLALFRIGLGVCIFIDVLTRLNDVSVFYSDSGLYPRDLAFHRLHQTGWSPYSFSFYFINGSSLFAFFLMALTTKFASNLIWGWRFRMGLVGLWALMVSLYYRNPWITHQGDVLMLCLLIWSFFLPLSATYSIDSALTLSPEDETPEALILVKQPSAKPEIATLGTAAVMLQIVLMYLVTATLKNHAVWREDFTALFHALSIDYYVRPLGHWLLQFPELLKGLTATTLGIEFIAPVLILLPYAPLRLLGIALLLALQTGIASTMNVGLFPVINMVALSLFLPSAFWNGVQSAFKRILSTYTVTVYYDGDCGFCKKVMCIIMTLFALPKVLVKVDTAQSDPAVFQRMEAEDSWVLYAQGEYYYRFDAFLELIKLSPFLFWARPFLVLFRLVGNVFYRIVAKNRMLFSSFMRVLKFHPIKPYRLNVPEQSLLVVLISMILSMNVGVLFNNSGLTPFWFHLSRVSGLTQYWRMFAPSPYLTNNWVRVFGIREDGTTMDLLHPKQIMDASLHNKKPLGLHRMYKNVRWQKYLENISTRSGDVEFRALHTYYCERYTTSTNPVKQVKIVTYEQAVDTSAQPNHQGKLTSTVKWQASCPKLVTD